MNRLEPIPRKTFGQLFPQLFLFPLFLVVIGVLVVLFFKASAEDTRTVEEIIADMETEGAHARRQDSYTLATSEEARNLSPEATRRLLRLLDRLGEDAETAKFVTMVLGRGGDPEIVLDRMVRIALDPAADLESRARAVQALNLRKLPQSVETFRKILETPSAGEDWEIRLYALSGLANFQDPSGVPLLRAALSDPCREIRWNSAAMLARTYGDASGKEILWKMTDWSFLDSERGERQAGLHPVEKESCMVLALDALHRLEGDGLRSFLEEKARDPRSLKVQNAARRLLDGKAVEGNLSPSRTL
jgi:hypothetical protein